MNKEEFLEMKDEFASVVMNYERFMKDGILLDYRYNYIYADILDKIHYYEVENGLLVRSIQLVTQQNAVLGDVQALITDLKEKYNNEKEAIARKHELAKIVTEHFDQTPHEDTIEFDKVFAEYIKECHPAVKALVTDAEKKLFEFLKACFYENNYPKFKEVYEANKQVISPVEYTEEMYTQISSYYYDVRKNISMDYNKRVLQYPYTKKEVFKDDMSVAYEQGELKTAVTQLMRDNKKLHEDFQKQFGFDVSLAKQD